jgi:hypothetical protein
MYPSCTRRRVAILYSLLVVTPRFNGDFLEIRGLISAGDKIYKIDCMSCMYVIASRLL